MSDASPVPRIPRALYRRSGVRAALGILYGLGLWVVPLAGLNLLWQSSFELAVRLALSVPLVIVSAQGLVLLGFLAHDGTHLNLHASKRWSAVIGITLTIPLWPHAEIGFAVYHWNHHRYTNTASDPDSACYGRFRTFLSRLLFARFAAMGGYFAAMVRLALGRPLDVRYRLPFKDGAVTWLARFNVVTWLAGLAIMVLTWISNPTSFYLLVAVVLVAIGLLGLNPYLEHAGTGVGHGHDTRSRRGWWWDLFYLGQNLHTIHHLYPSVPFYNLRKVYAHLAQAGYFDEGERRHVTRGFLRTYRHALHASPYPGAEAADDTFDVVGTSLASADE